MEASEEPTVAIAHILHGEFARRLQQLGALVHNVAELAEGIEDGNRFNRLVTKNRELDGYLTGLDGRRPPPGRTRRCAGRAFPPRQY